MTHEQNERLLTLLSEYLCFQPDAIAPADVAAFSADAHLPQEDAYRMLLSAKLGLCLLYTSPSPRDGLLSRMPSSA